MALGASLPTKALQVELKRGQLYEASKCYDFDDWGLFRHTHCQGNVPSILPSPFQSSTSLIRRAAEQAGWRRGEKRCARFAPRG